MSQRWEYQIVTLETSFWGSLDQKKLTESFNALGRLGWELVGVTHSPMTNVPTALFKRPLG